MALEHLAIKTIRNTILELFPQKNPEEQEELLKLVLKYIDDNAKTNPNLANNMEELKPHIKEISLFEDEFNKSVKQHTNLNDTEKNDLKKEVKKEMDELTKKGLDLKKNPKAFETMMKLLVLKHCLYPSPELRVKYKLGLKHRLKIKSTKELEKELEKSLLSLKMEYLKLLKQFEKTDPKLVQELQKIMKDIFLDIEQKLKSGKENIEPKEELGKLFRIIMVLSTPEFKDLPPEDRVTIITQGSKSGQYAMFPRNDVDMPNDIIVFPNTPLENEKKEESDLRKTPTPNPDK